MFCELKRICADPNWLTQEGKFDLDVDERYLNVRFLESDAMQFVYHHAFGSTWREGNLLDASSTIFDIQEQVAHMTKERAENMDFV